MEMFLIYRAINGILTKTANTLLPKLHLPVCPKSQEISITRAISDKYLRRVNVPAPRDGVSTRHSSPLSISSNMAVADLWESRIAFWRLFPVFPQQGGKPTQGVASPPAFSTHTFSLGCLSIPEVWLGEYHSTQEVSSWPSLI